MNADLLHLLLLYNKLIRSIGKGLKRSRCSLNVMTEMQSPIQSIGVHENFDYYGNRKTEHPVGFEITNNDATALLHVENERHISR